MSSWGGGIIRLKRLSLRVPHKTPDHGRFSLRARQRSGSFLRDTQLRQVDVLVSQGRKVAEAIRSSEVTDATYYRWRSEYGGLKGRSGQAAEVPGDREPTTSSGNRRPDPGDAHSHGGGFGTQRAAPAKLLSAACRNASPAVSWAGIVRRSAGLPSRSRSHRRPPSSPSLWQYERCGYRRITALQQYPSALLARIPATCAGGRHLANGTERISAARSPRHRHATDDALTSDLGHRMGAGHIGAIRLDAPKGRDCHRRCASRGVASRSAWQSTC
ncbi:hypothetical protein MBLL_03551 [Methylobacterium bullatum]|uniref:Transposase n=1 Tax=Methylobacterium bullatum TaxID=570505 RepID=A0A679K7K3_9HYPH|nr:hypothetical protein MBLL_03551 [Methylobacterium bullatum]